MQNDLHWPVLSKQKTNNRLQFTMKQNFIKSAFWKTCFHGGDLTASCEMWCSHQHCCLLVCDILQCVMTAPTFHRYLCFHQDRRWKQ